MGNQRREGLADGESLFCQMAAALVAHGYQRDFFPLCDPLGHAALHLGVEVRIEGAAQPLVGTDGDQHHLALGRSQQQRMGRRVDMSGHLLQQLGEPADIGAGAVQFGVGPAQLGRGHGLHRLGQLLGVAHRTDAPPQVDELARHPALHAAAELGGELF